MKDFTFVMITYNQEQYVVEHLESIKYQIEHFGQNIKINFILADDASNDKTAYKVKKWIESNQNLFFSVKFIIAVENRGIVSNVISALKNIKTEYYKILAGDDIYFRNNVFELCSLKKDVVFTPLIRFNDENILKNDAKWFHKELLLFQSKHCNVQKIILDSLGYSMNLESPGMFIKKSIINSSVYNFLIQFRYIDDVPFIYSLLKENTLDVFISDKPYILYRIQSGISTNKKHNKYAEFVNEHKLLNNMIFVKRKNNKYLNYFKYKYKLKEFLYKYNILNRYNKTIQSFINNTKKEEKFAVEYLKLINKKARNWEQKIFIKKENGNRY